MRRVAVVLACLLLGPAGAQDGKEPEIEIGDGLGSDPRLQRDEIGFGALPLLEREPALAGHESSGAAIELALRWLRARQASDGSWGPANLGARYGNAEVEGWVRDPLGPTAFVLYTLAVCGADAKDRVVKKGLRFIERQTKARDKRDESFSPYESAAIVLMLEAVYNRGKPSTGTPNEHKRPSRIPSGAWRSLSRHVLALTTGTRGGRGARGPGALRARGAQVRSGPNAGGWGYIAGNGAADVSVTHFVLLALRATLRTGYPIPSGTWRLARKYLQQVRSEHGGFGYRREDPPGPTTTASGLIGLLICMEQFGRPGPILQGGKFVDVHQQKIEAALKLVEDPARLAPAEGRAPANLYFHFWSIEQLEALWRPWPGGTRLRKAATVAVLGQQRADGHWFERACAGPRSILTTCFAVLFLKRGTQPARIK